MRKERIVIIVLLIVIVVISGAWIISSQPRGKDWVAVGTWRGTQSDYNMTTEQFVITGEEWQVYYACGEIAANSHFDIFVYDVYNGNIVKEIVSPYQTFSGNSYLNAQGRFYLQIFIRGNLGSNWVVSVQQYT